MILCPMTILQVIDFQTSAHHQLPASDFDHTSLGISAHYSRAQRIAKVRSGYKMYDTNFKI